MIVIRVWELNDKKESDLKYEIIVAMILHGRCNGSELPGCG